MSAKMGYLAGVSRGIHCVLVEFEDFTDPLSLKLAMIAESIVLSLFIVTVIDSMVSQFLRQYFCH
ncbi:MAG: hypothetical protein ACK5MF_03685 [Vibrio sp.]|uniref:hypothetical protein n=1 Tax=Vibrio sp. TaxID=678 RepID=UPI003A857336